MIPCGIRTEDDARHRTAGGEGRAGPTSKIHNNKRRILGTEWSMYEAGNPPSHNSDKSHGMVAIKDNTNREHEPSLCYTPS